MPANDIIFEIWSTAADTLTLIWDLSTALTPNVQSVLDQTDPLNNLVLQLGWNFLGCSTENDYCAGT